MQDFLQAKKLVSMPVVAWMRQLMLFSEYFHHFYLEHSSFNHYYGAHNMHFACARHNILWNALVIYAYYACHEATTRGNGMEIPKQQKHLFCVRFSLF